MSNPVDTLRKPTRRAPWIVGFVAGAGLVVTAAIAGPSIAANLNPAPTPTPAAIEYHATLTPAEQDTVQQQADQQAATIIADQKAADAAKAAADAATAAKASQHSSAGWPAGQAPAGTPIPLHLDNDPNSGSYGQMVIENPDQFCASNGGTTAANGEAVCS